MTADKRRTDACLKACEGISTQNLEDNVPFLELARQYNVVLRERDALREQQEINLSDPAVQKRLAVQWGYVPAGAQPEPSEQDASVRKSWARFSHELHRSPDAPYPGMADAFEQHFSQSFTDREWRAEASTWAAAWKAAKRHGAQPAPSVPEGWLRAIDEALVTAHIGVANAHDTYEQAKAKLDNLIGFNVDIATDPAVNGGYKLVPIEPTTEMICEMERQWMCGSQIDMAKREWKAACAAAPEAKPTPSVPDTYAAGINAVAAMLQSKADEYAKEHGHDDMGGLSFGPGMGGEIKMDYYTNLIELVDDVRAMLADAPSVPNDVVEQAVNRFLSWKLPKDFHPDGGMVFIPTKGRGYDSPHWPAGTNLLNAQQAREMLRYVLNAAPEAKP